MSSDNLHLQLKKQILFARTNFMSFFQVISRQAIMSERKVKRYFAINLDLETQTFLKLKFL